MTRSSIVPGIPSGPPSTPFINQFFDRFTREYEQRFERTFGPLRGVVPKTVERFFGCGLPVEGIARALGGAEWVDLAKTHLLTDGE